MRFKWWQFAIVIGLAAGFVVALFAIAEFGRARVVQAADAAQLAQQQWIRVVDLRRVLTDAEGGHRGFLLTGDERFLEPLADADRRVEGIAAELAAFSTGRDPRIGAAIATMRDIARSTLSDMKSSVAIYRSEGAAAALARDDAAARQEPMRQFRQLASITREYEQALLEQARINWDAELAIVHRLNIATLVVGLSLAALAIGGMYRSMKQRQEAAAELARQRDDLHAQAQAQAAELAELYRHLQHVQEEERARLSRGLHDELGSLLLTARMDVTSMERSPPVDAADMRERLARIRVAIDQGIDLKRRVVEELRPTLLDTMGLVAALRWQVEETCNRADLRCAMDVPEEEPPFSRTAAITLFRIAQEALTNVVKHAKATAVSIALEVTETEVVLRVSDDGVGATLQNLGRPRAHGVAGMRHRVQVLGGRLDITTSPGSGTKLTVRVPLASAMKPTGPDTGSSGIFAAVPWATADAASPGATS